MCTYSNPPKHALLTSTAVIRIKCSSVFITVSFILSCLTHKNYFYLKTLSYETVTYV